MICVIAPAVATAVLDAAATHHATTRDALRGPGRQPDLVRARASVAYLLRRLTAGALVDIGAELNRSHQSVIRLLGAAEQRRLTEADYSAWLKATAEEIAAAHHQVPPPEDLPLFGGAR